MKYLGAMPMNVTVEKEWLKDRLNDKDIKIIDCRFDLGNPAKGEELYRESHLPGAFYFDLDKQLSGPVKKHGGRHPLPNVDDFKHELEKVGIDHAKTVIVYDGGEGAFASRFWWILTYFGHEEVYILNGGFKEWVEAGYPVTKEIPNSSPSHFEVKLKGDMLATYEEVKAIVDKGEKSPILIDSREEKRYLGEIEPLDRIAGHIPGAINKFWQDGMENGTFKNEEEQKKRFKELDVNEPIIVYCGSGVTATPNYIALKMAGFKHVKLYAGSYSDWVSYEDNPVATGKEEK